MSERTSAGKKPARKKLNRRQKVRRRRIALVCMVGLSIISLITVGILSLFRVRGFKVTGEIPYTKEEVITASDIKMNQSIFTVDEVHSKDCIEATLPYTDNVKVSKKMPSTVMINADTARAIFAVEMSRGVFAVTNGELKILETSGTIPEGSIVIQGRPYFPTYEIGKELSFNEGVGEDPTKNVLIEISNALSENELDKIDIVDITGLDRIYLIYDGRIVINIGSSETISKKLSLAKKTIDEENKLSPSQYGELDVTMSGKAIFAPKDYKDIPELVQYFEDVQEFEKNRQENSESAENEPVTALG